MFHSTAMVGDYDEARDRLAVLAGLAVLEYSVNDQPGIGRRGGMTWVGDNSIELGQPTVASGGPARFVASSGGGMHSVAVQVHDVEESMAHVDACGVRVAARPMPDFFFTDPRDTNGVLLQWGSFELDVDPRFGAAIPEVVVEPLLNVRAQAFVGAVVDDPVASAALFTRAARYLRHLRAPARRAWRRPNGRLTRRLHPGPVRPRRRHGVDVGARLPTAPHAFVGAAG